MTFHGLRAVAKLRARKRFPFWQPASKGPATITARTLRAWAADMQQVALGLQFAAAEYEKGHIEEGRYGAHSAMNYLGIVVRSYRDKFGPIDSEKQLKKDLP